MKVRGDDRAQSNLVGFILLFGMLVVAFSSYQAVVVPNQNAEVEYNHNIEAQNQMQDVRSAIIRAAGTGNTQSANVQLGTTYPARLIALNPPAPAGTLETSDATELNVSIENGTPENEQLQAYWANSTRRNFTTQPIAYRPSYNEYQNAPDTLLEHTILYNRFDSNQITQSDQALVSGRYLSFAFVDGDYQRSQSGTVDIDAAPVSAPSKQVTISGPLEISLQTGLSNETWTDLLADEIDAGNVEVLGFNEGDPNEIELRFTRSSYNLRMASIRAGAEGDQPEPADAAYITRVGGETVQVDESFAFEVRDRYNNPVSGVAVDVDGETIETDSDGRVTLSRGSSGTVEASIGGESWETDEIEVLAASDGGDTVLGPVTKNVTADPQSVTQGDPFDLTATADSVGDGTQIRSGTPIQSFRWESVGPTGQERAGEFSTALDPDTSDRNETQTTSIDTTGWEIGEHTVTVIARDASGRETDGSERGQVTVTVTSANPDAPTVETQAASGVDTDSATLNGELTDLGTASEVDVSFEYRQTGSSTWTQTATQTRTATGTFNETISGLDSGTDYEFRAVAESVDGSTTGGILTFTTDTDPGDPAVETQAASGVDTDSATLNGELTDLGTASDVDVSFEYRQVGATAWTQTGTQTRTTTGTFSETITGLDPGTDYEFRAVAESVDGSDTGGILTFTTTTEPPVVETDPATGIGTSETTLNGELTDLGTASEVDVSFEYRQTGSSTWVQTGTQTRTGTGTFSETITGLDSGTEYEFRAVAESTDDSDTGDTLTFTTASAPATIEVVGQEAIGNNEEIDVTFNVANNDGTTDQIRVFLEDQPGGGQGANWATKQVTINADGEPEETFVLTDAAANDIGVNLNNVDLYDAANYESATQASLDELRDSITVDSTTTIAADNGDVGLDVSVVER